MPRVFVNLGVLRSEDELDGTGWLDAVTLVVPDWAPTEPSTGRKPRSPWRSDGVLRWLPRDDDRRLPAGKPYQLPPRPTR